jgi:hypothetical protein
MTAGEGFTIKVNGIEKIVQLNDSSVYLQNSNFTKSVA